MQQRLREGVGVVSHCLLGEGDLGEADHRMGPLTVWPSQAEPAGEGDERVLVVVLAAPGGVLDPSCTWSGGSGGAFGQAFAGD
jgi:hypothetical protein